MNHTINRSHRTSNCFEREKSTGLIMKRFGKMAYLAFL